MRQTEVGQRTRDSQPERHTGKKSHLSISESLSHMKHNLLGMIKKTYSLPDPQERSVATAGKIEAGGVEENLLLKPGLTEFDCQ